MKRKGNLEVVFFSFKICLVQKNHVKLLRRQESYPAKPSFWHLHTHLHRSTRTCTHLHTNALLHTRTKMHTRTHTLTLTNRLSNTDTLIHTCTHMHTYTQTHTDSQIQTHSYTHSSVVMKYYCIVLFRVFGNLIAAKGPARPSYYVPARLGIWATKGPARPSKGPGSTVVLRPGSTIR